jgi:glycosyltransferase involved in cell wall biosynthesis
MYFPVEEGLGHYTTEFCRHLAKLADVAVWTTRSRGSVGKMSGHAPGRVELIDNVRRWNRFGPFTALRQALRFDPDRILIQFVPFMYSTRGGINFSLVALSLFLAARGRLLRKGHVEIMFHEIWYPFSWRPKDAVMHVAHRLMAFGITVAAKRSFCATTLFVTLVERNARPFKRPIEFLAVGSNLEREHDGPRQEGPPHSPDELRIGLFGSAHPSKRLPVVLRALRKASRAGPRRLKLQIVGMSRDQVCAEAPDLADWIEKEVDVAGVLEANEAADRLGTLDFVVSYFSDGVSSRRGSLLAALCEGAPVVTTWADWSDEVFRGRAFVKLLSCDEAVFSSELCNFLAAAERPFSGVTRDDVREFYRQNFSWSAIVDRYAALSGLATRG